MLGHGLGEPLPSIKQLKELFLRFGRRLDDFGNLGAGADSTVKVKPFQGHVDASGEPIVDRNAQMLLSLAKAIELADDVGENDGTPAGYTYLAQLMTHDLVESASPFPRDIEEVSNRRDLRTRRLLLDTVYGGGPASKPLAYEFTDKAEPRKRLRLGGFNEPRDHAAHVRQDIPRSGCPYLQDKRYRDGTCVDPRNLLMPDVLIADARNDDNPVLSQLTALFHILHNYVLEWLETHQDEISALEYPLKNRPFLQARKVAVYIYRQILIEDLFPRILNNDVVEHYKKKLNEPDPPSFIDIDTNRVPVEFSHAALRACHTMVRNQYKFNDKLHKKIRDVLRFNSGNPARVPLRQLWLVDWNEFFSIDGSTPQPARKIGPSIANDLGASGKIKFVPNPDGEGRFKLLDLDFLRGMHADLWSLTPLVEFIASSGQLDRILKSSPLLSDPNTREKEVRTWLEDHSKYDGKRVIAPVDIEVLVEDPPLFFFVLLEAHLPKKYGGERGQRLGRLGSIIVCEVLFRALRETQAFVNDPESQATPKLASRIFDGNPPEDMPALIKALDRKVRLWSFRSGKLVHSSYS